MPPCCKSLAALTLLVERPKDPPRRYAPCCSRYAVMHAYSCSPPSPQVKELATLKAVPAIINWLSGLQEAQAQARAARTSLDVGPGVDRPMPVFNTQVHLDKLAPFMAQVRSVVIYVAAMKPSRTKRPAYVACNVLWLLSCQVACGACVAECCAHVCEHQSSITYVLLASLWLSCVKVR